MNELDAQVIDMWAYIGKRANEEQRAYVEYLQATRAHDHYYATMGRLRDEYGPKQPELIARPILRLVDFEDQQ